MNIPEELTVISSGETNRILGSEPQMCKNTTVEFEGKHNILFMEKGVRLKDARIHFKGDNALLYLSKGKSKFNTDIELETNAACVFGHNVFMNGSKPLNVRVREGTSLVIGNDCLFSLAITIDTKMKNSAKSILIDQHVWLGQKVTITGGSRIMGGAVIGSDTQIDRKKIPAGSCWGCRNGKLKKLYKNIVFIKKSIRNISRENLGMNDTISEDELQEILTITGNNWKWVLKMIENVSSSEEKLSLLRESRARRKYKRPEYKNPDEDMSYQEESEALGNRIIGNFSKCNTKIRFRGNGNVLIVEDGVELRGSRLAFRGDNSLVYLSKNKHPYRIKASIHTDTNIFIGEDNRFTKGSPLNLSAAEAQSILIGNHCSFGEDVWLRTSDQHPIYDQKTRKRINPAKSILIENSSDIPDEALIFKGRWIGIKKEADSDNKYVQALKELQETTDLTKRIDTMLKLRSDAPQTS